MDSKRFLLPNLNKTFIRFLFIIIISLIILLIQSPPFFFLDLSFHFSTFPFFSQTLQRKFIFLICNGILAILGKSLSLSSTSSPNFMAEDQAEDAAFIPLAELNVIDATDLGTVTTLTLDQERQNKKKNGGQNSNCDIFNSNDKKHARETNSILITELDEDDEDQDGEENGEDEDQEGEETGDLMMMLGSSADQEDIANDDARVNTEEFNKKIEEFIRKMKEELMIEAQQQQQQLVAV